MGACWKRKGRGGARREERSRGGGSCLLHGEEEGGAMGWMKRSLALQFACVLLMCIFGFAVT
jgi:hypothetical protein